MNRKPARSRLARVSGAVSVAGGSVGTTTSAPSVDTGNLLLTDSYTAPIGVDFRPCHLFAANITDEIALLSLTDGPGTLYLDRMPLGPREPFPLSFGGQTFAGGLKWKCEPTNTIRAQMVGDPA